MIRMADHWRWSRRLHLADATNPGLHVSQSMRQLRLVHTIPGLASESSGTTRCVVRLAQSLACQGDDVRVATLHRGGEPQLPGLHTFPVTLGMNRLGVSTSMHRWLHAQAVSGTIDLIHSHSMWMMPAIYPSWVSARTGVPLVVSPHGSLSSAALRSGSRIKPMWWNCVQRPALRKACLFHATSESEAQYIRDRGFKAPIALIPNGVDIPPPDDGFAVRQKVVAFLGRIHPIKGVDTLLRAWREIERTVPEWQLHIAGPDSDPYALRMKALAGHLGLNRVTFLGELRGDAKYRFLMKSSLFVLPSLSENFGMAVAESLACGTPAIVTRGAPWAGLTSHEAGWWVEGDDASLVTALTDATRAPSANLASMGHRGRSWMERDFAWETIASQFHATYSWILHGGTAPPWVHR